MAAVNAFDHNAATVWAESCAYGCSECPDDQSCGCTYFTTHALVHGGWGGGYIGTCATLWSNFKAGKYSGWVSVSRNEADVQEGFAVIMNNGNGGDASHCCVGTGKGLVSCHNPGHKDVPPSSTWYSGGGINAIWGWSADIRLSSTALKLLASSNSTAAQTPSTISAQAPPAGVAETMKHSFVWSRPNYQDVATATATAKCADGVTDCSTTVTGTYFSGFLEITATPFGNNSPDGFMITVKDLMPASVSHYPTESDCSWTWSSKASETTVKCANAAKGIKLELHL